MRNTGLQDQDVCGWPTRPGEAVVLIDPNQLRSDGTTALTGGRGQRGRRVGRVRHQRRRSDWRTWRVRSTASGEDLPDRIGWSKFASSAWAPDGSGFVYGRYPEPPPDAAYERRTRNMELATTASVTTHRPIGRLACRRSPSGASSRW